MKTNTLSNLRKKRKKLQICNPRKRISKLKEVELVLKSMANGTRKVTLSLKLCLRAKIPEIS